MLNRYIDPYLFENFKDFKTVIDFPLFGHSMRDGSAGGESVFSLQCSGSTLSLPSEINSSSFLQGSRICFSNNLTTAESSD